MKIQCLVGMIASGKSTYARNAAKTGSIIVNDDAIVNAVHADDYTLYSESLKVLYKSVENHLVVMSLALNRTAVVDRGLNVSVDARRRWVSLTKSLDVPCEAIVFKNEGPEVHANRRAEVGARGHDRSYWLKVAEFHNSHYQEPTTTEGFDSVHYISFEEIRNGKVF